jgi:hypothetical protein
MIFEDFFELFLIFSFKKRKKQKICYRISFGKYFSQNGENLATKKNSLA